MHSRQSLISVLNGEERESAERELLLHRENASSEYFLYNKIGRRQNSRPENGKLHLVFDFTEKVLLPSMERQPGNLHFVTRLKYDLLGISKTRFTPQLNLSVC